MTDHHRTVGWVVSRARDPRVLFVGVNLAVNLIVFVRAYLTMQFLDYRELGLVALLQTTILLIGALQLGFFNGGYRLMCSASPEEAVRINGQVYSFLGLITLAATAVAALALIVLAGGEGDLVALLGLAGGIATLLRNWLANQLVARGELARLNWVNGVSAVLSIAVMALVTVAPLGASLASVVTQPIAFVVIAILIDRRLLPHRLGWNGPLVRRILQAGLAIFVSGMLLQLITQLERWYVAGLLGLDALGHLYLVTLFATVFQMVPASLDQVFLPPIVRAHEEGRRDELHKNMRHFLLAMTAYCALTAAALALLAKPLVAWLLPEYVPDLRYVYLGAPGLVALAMTGPFAVVFNVLIRYRYFSIGYAVGVVLMAGVLGCSLASGRLLDLAEVSILRSGAYVAIAVILLIGFARLTREWQEFRFSLWPRRSALTS